MPTNQERGGGRPERPVYLDEGAFTLKNYTAGAEGIVASAQVPSNQVWRIPTGSPLVVALVAKQTVTVSADAAGESLTLDPVAPIVDYMPNVADGATNYTTDANIVAYMDDTGDGNKDTLVTGATTVSYSGTFGTDGDFIESVSFDNSEASTNDVDVYTVVRHGYTKIQKRNSGKGNISQELQTEDSITWAFSNPDDPNSDRQITWEPRNGGLRGVIPPKFNLDLVYFDNSYTTALDAAKVPDDVQLEISLPVSQRPLRRNESAADLRRKVSQNMAGP